MSSATIWRCGIDSVSVVVGYEAEQIEAKLVERSDLGIEANSLYNPFFRSTANLVSLWMARVAMTEDFVNLNGDDVFSRTVLDGILATGGELTAVVTKKSRYDADDTKIGLDDARIVRIGKEIPGEEADAEWIGMCKMVDQRGSGSFRSWIVR